MRGLEGGGFEFEQKTKKGWTRAYQAARKVLRTIPGLSCHSTLGRFQDGGNERDLGTPCLQKSRRSRARWKRAPPSTAPQWARARGGIWTAIAQ